MKNQKAEQKGITSTAGHSREAQMRIRLGDRDTLGCKIRIFRIPTLPREIVRWGKIPVFLGGQFHGGGSEFNYTNKTVFGPV